MSWWTAFDCIARRKSFAVTTKNDVARKLDIVSAIVSLSDGRVLT